MKLKHTTRRLEGVIRDARRDARKTGISDKHRLSLRVFAAAGTKVKAQIECDAADMVLSVDPADQRTGARAK